MAKAKRMIKACLPLVDGVVEILDARIPYSSRNPDLNDLTEGKPRIVILAKCDIADDKKTCEWIKYFKSKGLTAFAADFKSGKGLNEFVPAVNEALCDVIKKNKEKGMGTKVLHLMVVGIPNVGKSSFINKEAGRKKTAVADKPGVTRDKQWVRINDKIELLDMPGVLWPKFEDKLVGERLAFTGAVRDEIYDSETLACRLLMYLNENCRDKLVTRFKLIPENEQDGYELLKLAGKSRGMLVSGGEINTERAALTVLDEFRSGKIGKITLETPNTDF